MDVESSLPGCDEAGFGLIEVLVAMTLLSLAASVWLGALLSSSVALRSESLRAEAVSVAEGLSSMQVSLPSRVCGSALSDALGGVPVSDSLCAVSACAGNTCSIMVSDSAGSVILEASHE